MGVFMHSGDSASPVPGGIPAGTLERIEADIEELRSLRATLEQYGMGIISESESVTDTDSGLVLGAKEKNASITGSIMNFVEKNKQLIESISESSFIFRGTVTDFNSVEKSGFYQYPGANGIGVPQTYAYGILLNLIGDSFKYQIFLSMSGDFKFIYVRKAATLSAAYGSWNYIELK